MITSASCLACFLQQTERTAAEAGCTTEKTAFICREIERMLGGCDLSLCPPAIGAMVYAKIKELTGCEDPYQAKKLLANHQAKEHLALLQRRLNTIDDSLMTILRLAIAGNILDYGVPERFDRELFLQQCLDRKLAIDDSAYFANVLDRLKAGQTILYLADNCGEIMYDSLLVQYMAKRSLAVVVAVKDGPIINDATEADAQFAGLADCARIVSNGSRTPGTVLDHCSDEFRFLFDHADFIIAKGQGNLESLLTSSRPICFLTTIKCRVAATALQERAGLTDTLHGEGEMVVYCPNKGAWI
jgi:uncharacterized protein with ATP-grasp and redox domains